MLFHEDIVLKIIIRTLIYLFFFLRNLFFRTSFLLLLGVKPIFVLEGKAPVLKHDTIERRQIAQGKAAGRNVKAGSRARLKGLQTQVAIFHFQGMLTVNTLTKSKLM